MRGETEQEEAVRGMRLKPHRVRESMKHKGISKYDLKLCVLF